ncbi:MAG: 50S ribosomal protein L4 [Deltaproteobacteria bacterium]|jgi:large subunit ribosomal protein L4|nr:50S ribosomal protein L4 [Deltaproteobacteria bacterium]
MPTADIYNLLMEKVGELDLDDRVFGATPKPWLVHEAVRAQLASRRRGTADTKTRGEVAFSTRKPYRQKKTGRARMGTRRSPLLRKGGVIFGPHPRDYSFRPPSKVRKGALISVLSSLLSEKRLLVIDDFPLPEPKTRLFHKAVLKLGYPTLTLVIPGRDPFLERAARNIPTVRVLRQEGLNCYDLLRLKNLVLLKDAVPMIEERLAGKGSRLG